MNIAEQFNKQKDANVDDGVIPLINVVFLMLIFFMVAGHIQKSDPIEINPPESINDAQSNIDAHAVFVLGNNQELYLNDQAVSLEEVQPMLSALYEQSAQKEQFWVQIKADAQISIAQMRPLFNEVRQSGLSKVSIATQLRKDK